MKRTKKIVSFLIIAVFTVIFSACTAKEKEPVTLSIWHVYGAQTESPLNDLIDIFNDTVGKEEGIQIQVTMVSNNNNIHKDILAAANEEPGAPRLPDIFVAYPKTVLAMPDESVLVDYRDYFSEEELGEFIPAFLEDGTVNGRLVSLPVAKSTELLFVNKTEFDRFSKETGARLEDLQTWEGLFETACRYAEWTDSRTPDILNDEKSMFVHDFHFNYFQVGIESLGEDFFRDEELYFSDTFRKIWEPYAKAAISGGLWLQGGYATEPLRTGESIVSVASSASVLYFSNEVIHADNTTEIVELIARPCPVFENGSFSVMQRGAGMCTVKSEPKREKAAIAFLQWLTDAECNTQFAVETGYMPVTQTAFDSYLAQEISSLTEQKYQELYKAYQGTQAGYEFYSAPQFKRYLEMETNFEEKVRLILQKARNEYLEAGGEDQELLMSLIDNAYEEFMEMVK